jgi:hypothetical protein
MEKMAKIALLLLALGVSAIAQKPVIEAIPFTSAFVPAAAACGFDVLVLPQEGKPNGEKIIQFANTAIITGPLFVTLTNLSTGRSINQNNSGPALLSFSGTTTSAVFLGSFALGPLPPNVAAAAGLPLFSFIHGRVELTIDAQGNITSIQNVTGTVEDQCPLLQ